MTGNVWPERKMNRLQNNLRWQAERLAYKVVAAVYDRRIIWNPNDADLFMRETETAATSACIKPCWKFTGLRAKG